MSIQNIEQYFHNRDWKCERLKDNVVKMPLKCDNSTFTFYVDCISTESGDPNVLGIRVYIAQGMFNNITEGKKLEIYNALNTLSNDYYFGKFYLDEDNDILLNHFLSIHNKFVDEEDFFRALDGICAIADEAFAALMKLRWA